MDIAQMAMNMAQTNTVTAFSTAMLDKTLDLVESQGAMMAQTISQAPAPSLESMVYPNTMGTKIDMTV